jgi:hypothetical protein
MSLILLVLGLVISPILVLMSFVFPLNIIAFVIQILFGSLIFWVFLRRKKKSKGIIFTSIPLGLHAIFLIAILVFGSLSFSQYETNDMAKIALGVRRFLAVKVGLNFLMPKPEELEKFDKMQKEQKKMAEIESKRRYRWGFERYNKF